MKAPTPTNSLGIYLTKKDIQNKKLSEDTGIPESDLSKMRNGDIESIPAKRLYQIKNAIGVSMSEILKEVYPNIDLANENKPTSTKINVKTSELGKLIYSLEDNNLDILAHKTGIKRSRLLRLTHLDNDKIDGHELYLIELATNKNPGELFKQLYG